MKCHALFDHALFQCAMHFGQDVAVAQNDDERFDGFARRQVYASKIEAVAGKRGIAQAVAEFVFFRDVFPYAFNDSGGGAPFCVLGKD